MIAELVLDLTLALLVLCLAWGALYATTLIASISFFVGFGLILSLIWARLGAPDLALAEAAIGAGLTGVLLLQAAAATDEVIPSTFRRPPFMIPSLIFIVIVIALVATTINRGPDAISQQVPLLPLLAEQNMADSGVSHPVTAVLLNFRSWDTLLELLVLLMAFLGIRHLFPEKPARGAGRPPPWSILLNWSRLLAPLLVIVGGYLLWAGSTSPGGAFQAGALLAAAAVILRLNNLLPPIRWSQWPLRMLVLAGAVLFSGVAAWTAVFGEAWLQYPPQHSYGLIILIELAATISIGATLALLVAGEREDLCE